MLALASLLRPLLWVGLLIPVLPMSAWDVIDAPVPYLLGLLLEGQGVREDSGNRGVRRAPRCQEDLAEGQVCMHARSRNLYASMCTVHTLLCTVSVSMLHCYCFVSQGLTVLWCHCDDCAVISREAVRQ